MLSGDQARDILKQQFLKSLPRIWTNVRCDAKSMANEELVDYVVQIMEKIGDCKLEETLFGQNLQQNNPTTLANIPSPSNQILLTLNYSLSSNMIFATNDSKIETQNGNAFLK